MAGSKKKPNAPKKKGMAKVRAGRVANDETATSAKKGSRKTKAR